MTPDERAALVEHWRDSVATQHRFRETPEWETADALEADGARIDELEGALRPFAEANNFGFKDDHPGSTVFTSVRVKPWTGLKVRDFRRAAEALAPASQAEPSTSNSVVESVESSEAEPCEQCNDKQVVQKDEGFSPLVPCPVCRPSDISTQDGE